MNWLRYIKHRWLTRRLKITVVYKSGAKVHTKVKHFSWKRQSGVTSYEWDSMYPSSVQFGADDVAAVWEGWV